MDKAVVFVTCSGQIHCYLRMSALASVAIALRKTLFAACRQRGHAKPHSSGCWKRTFGLQLQMQVALLTYAGPHPRALQWLSAPYG